MRISKISRSVADYNRDMCYVIFRYDSFFNENPFHLLVFSDLPQDKEYKHELQDNKIIDSMVK